MVDKAEEGRQKGDGFVCHRRTSQCFQFYGYRIILSQYQILHNARADQKSFILVLYVRCMAVSILGDRGCGKTVFLSLLYETQINYANETKGDFRFISSPGYVNTMGKIVNGLRMGNWPEATLKGLLSKYWFLFGYRKKFPPNKYDSVKFTIYDIAGEDVNIIDELITPYQDGGLDSILYEDLPEGLKTLLDCNVLVFLIDASRINGEARSEQYESMIAYDTFMATLISIVAEYKSKKAGEMKSKDKLYPVFIMTKFDMIDKKIFEGLKMPSKYPDGSKKNMKKRKTYAEKLMENFYRQTLALKYGGKLLNVDFDKAGYFFSEIRSELDEDGEQVPRLISKNGTSYGIDYSYSEYRAFIEYFRELAHQMPDEIKDEQEFKI